MLAMAGNKAELSNKKLVSRNSRKDDLSGIWIYCDELGIQQREIINENMCDVRFKVCKNS